MKHFLIVYHRREGKILFFKEYPPEEGRRALADRWERELAEREHPEIEVIVISSRSIETLKRTHGRYFKTPQELCA